MLDDGFHYVLLGEFQTDVIKRDFGIYRQQSGVNFYIPADQVLFSLYLQRLKLLKKLWKEPTNTHCQQMRLNFFVLIFTLKYRFS